MPKKYIHNKPGVGPNKVPPSWIDRDEDKVCARAPRHAGGCAARMWAAKHTTACPEARAVLLCAETQAQVLAWGQDSAAVSTNLAMKCTQDFTIPAQMSSCPAVAGWLAIGHAASCGARQLRDYQP